MNERDTDRAETIQQIASILTGAFASPSTWYRACLSPKPRAPICSHASVWRCFRLPKRLWAKSWNQWLTACCRQVPCGVPGSNPGGTSRTRYHACIAAKPKHSCVSRVSGG
jgi:hypothetical protein